MSEVYNKFIDKLKQKVFNPVYWIEGDEEYFINESVKYIENNILIDSQKQFDFSIFYGKESTFEQVFNACRKPPIIAPYNIVLLKEAHQFKDIKRFENYINKPLKQTILFFIYKDKIDIKTKFGTIIKEKTFFVNFALLKNLELEKWIFDFVNNAGYKIEEKALLLLLEQVGNNLRNLVNELNKLFLINKKNEKILFENVAEYIGISKEFNIFELQDAFTNKDNNKIIKIFDYMIKNSKNNPINQIIYILYTYFLNILLTIDNINKPEKEIAMALGLFGTRSFFVKKYIEASTKYTKQELEKNVLVLNEYNLKSIGINSYNVADEELKKELIMKLLLP